MEFVKRLRAVPWSRRIVTALCLILPVLTLLRFPLTGRLVIWGVCLLAASEHARLRNAVLTNLAASISPVNGTAAESVKVAPKGSVNPSTPTRKISTEKCVKGAEDISDLTTYQSSVALLASCFALFLTERVFTTDAVALPIIGCGGIVSIAIFLSYILLFTRHPSFPESRLILVYAWVAGGLDVYFIWHYGITLALGSVIFTLGGHPWMLVILIISGIGDCGALFCGSAFGCHHIFRKLSPNKTVEGVIGSFLWSFMVAFLLFVISRSYPGLELPTALLVDYLAVGGIMSFVGLIGDLIESAFKRVAGVKDSSTIFGPHGGMLDRLDSLALPLPFVFLFLRYKGLLQLSNVA